MDHAPPHPSLQGARLVLGVSPGASRADIRRAFLARAQCAHPDRPGGSAERYRRLVEAFQMLQAQTRSSPARERRLRFAAAWAA